MEDRERTIYRAILLGFEYSREPWRTVPTAKGFEVTEDFRRIVFRLNGRTYGSYNTIYAAACEWLRLNGFDHLICGELNVTLDNKNPDH